jgi:hypothetical protein
MLDRFHSSFRTATLESSIRTALELGELSPGAEAQIQRLATASNLSRHDRCLLALLKDAVSEGYIRRIQPLEPLNR